MKIVIAWIFPVAACLVLTQVATAVESDGATEWPQWRGATRNGAAGSDTRFAASAETCKNWPAVWKSSYPFPSDTDGGNANPVISGGRVFVYVNWISREPIDRFAVTSEALEKVGWCSDKPATEIIKNVEEARLSDERDLLQGREVNGWAAAWEKEHIADSQLRTKFHTWIHGRLQRGREGLSLPLLDKLASIRGQSFASQREIDAWLGQNGFEAAEKKEVRRATVKFRETAQDVVLCYDLASGEQLWEKRFPGEPAGRDCSATPCVAGNCCYVLGSGHLYSLDVKDGSTHFVVETGSRFGSASPAIHAGRVFVISGQLTAFDAATGKEIWKQPAVGHGNSSPLFCSCDGQEYLVCVSGSKDVVGVNPVDGGVLWRISLNGTLAQFVTSGNQLVIRSAGKLCAYVLASAKTEKKWELNLPGSGCGLIIHDSHVYVTPTDGVQGHTLCVALETGAVCWEQGKTTQGAVCGEPIVIDGKILFIAGNNNWGVIRATPERYEFLATWWWNNLYGSSPAIARRRLVSRCGMGLCCYEFPNETIRKAPDLKEVSHE